jgi:hypothetical protein
VGVEQVPPGLNAESGSQDAAAVQVKVNKEGLSPALRQSMGEMEANEGLPDASLAGQHGDDPCCVRHGGSP